MEFINIIPGCIHIKNALSENEQIELVKMSKSWIENLLPSSKTRNRVYDAINKFSNSEYLLNICKLLLTKAKELDKHIIVDDPTHLLFLQYTTKKGMGFHKDDGSNDGSGLNPVVSISIGNSCIFSIIRPDNGLQIDVTLNSGDVIIFGGPSRFMSHSVSNVIMNCPTYLTSHIGKVRLNYTLRYAPEILGKEDDYKTFDSISYTKNKKK